METYLKPALAVIAMFAFMICLYLLFFCKIPEGSKDVILIVVGAFIALVKDVYGYYFGSSEGSARKTEILNQETPVVPDPAIAVIGVPGPQGPVGPTGPQGEPNAG